MVDSGIPGGVPIMPLDDTGLAKDAFEGKPEALGCSTRRLIEGIALPRITPEAKVIEFYVTLGRRNFEGSSVSANLVTEP